MMASNYSNKLARLYERRQGNELISSHSVDSYTHSYSPPPQAALESYQFRAKSETMQYALGAMQAVDRDYTNVSFKEGDRVISQLKSKLIDYSMKASFEYQGSVPLDIHIKRHSDIDILVLDCRFRTYDPIPGMHYGQHSPYKAEHYLLQLREASETILRNAYTTPDVDTSGAKSISISGGTFRRKVDVVPAHWHDTVDFQHSGEKHDRVVKILDKTISKTLENFPFLHMKKINEKDALTNGGAKKIIRLLKTLKADSDQEISLSSYDIASLVWHFDNTNLRRSQNQEMALIAGAKRELEALCHNPWRARALRTPDNSREIIDNDNKFIGLNSILKEIEILSSDIAREINPYTTHYTEEIYPSLDRFLIS